MYKVKGKNGDEVSVYENGKPTTKTYEQLFNEHIYKPKRQLMFGCDVVDSSGNKVLSLGKEEMVSMGIEFDAVNGSKYQFGCLSCAKLNLEVKFSSVITKYSLLEPYIKLLVSYYIDAKTQRSEWITVPLGRFIAYEVKSQYLTRMIQAYDAAYAYDEDEITSFPHYNLILEEGQKCTDPYFTFSTKCTLGDIINYINTSIDFAKIRRRQGIDQIKCTEETPCTNLEKCEHDKEYVYPIIDVIKLELTPYLEMNVYDLDSNMTLRKFIGYLAGLQGKNAMFNRDGELEFRNPLEDARNFVYDGSHYGEYSEEDTTMKVSALQCSTVLGADVDYEEEYNVEEEYTEEEQRVNENGELVYDADGNPVMDTVTKTHTVSKKRTITKFEVSDVTYTEGLTDTTSINDICIFSNPLVKKEQLPDILGKVRQEYIPCKFKLKGDPRLEINSRMVLKRRKKTIASDTSYIEEEITIPIMKMKMRLNNSCFLEIEAVADLEEKKAATLSGSMTQRVGTLGKELSETTSMAKGMFMELYGSEASIGQLFSEKAQLGTVVTNKITAAEAEFQEVIANDITAGTGKIGTVISDKINASEVSTKNLIAEEIRAVNATIDEIDAKKVDTDYLFTDNAEIVQAKINSAFIDKLEASVIKGGTLDLSTGLTIGSGNSDDQNKETLVITENSIIMNSPKWIDKDGHTEGYTQRVIIGKKGSNYVVEINDVYGNQLWGAEGLTSGAVNNLGSGTVSGEVIESIHATKVLIDPNFSTGKTDPTEDGHISMYNYMMDLNTERVKVTDDQTLKQYLTSLEESTATYKEGITNNFNTVNGRIDDVINTASTNLSNLQEKDRNLEGQIGTINSNITNLQNKDNDLQNQIKSISDYNSEIADKNIPGRLDTAENNITDLNNNMTTVSGNMIALSERVDVIDNPTNGSIKTLQDSLDSKVDKSSIIDQINKSNEFDGVATTYRLINPLKILLDIGTNFNLAVDGSYNITTLGNYLNSREEDIWNQIYSINADLHGVMGENGEHTPGISSRVIDLENKVSQLETLVSTQQTTIQELIRRIEALESHHPTEPENPDEPEIPEPENPEPNPEEQEPEL